MIDVLRPDASASRKYRAAHPERVAATGRAYRARIAEDPTYREHKNAAHRAWYAAYVAEHPDYLARKREAARRHSDANPETVREQRRAASKRYSESHPRHGDPSRPGRRAAVLAFFGDVCFLCGFTDPRALQVDHINGGGHRERRAGLGTLSEQYRLVTERPDEARAKYQLLCANCNIVKGR
jgi:hypothetical protein